MTSPLFTRSGATSGKPSKQLAAAATAAIPVALLSSLAMTQPAAAAQTSAAPTTVPTSLPHGALTTAIKPVKTAPSVSAHTIAASLPSRIAPAAPVIPTTHTVVPGDTVSGIASARGLDADSLLVLNGLDSEALIYPGQVLILSEIAPPTAKASTQVERTSPSATAASRYVVVNGDTVSGIAAHHNVSLDSVLVTNGMTMTSNTIYPGQTLLITVGASAAAAAPAKSVPAKTPSKATAKAAPANAASKAKASTSGRYVIKAGDTLSAIAAQHGVDLMALAAANNMSINGVIYPGASLTIPGVSAAASAIVPDASAENLVPNTFLHYTYPDAVVADANKNKAALLQAPVPSPAQMKDMVASTAAKLGVDPSLAMAFAQQESGFDQQAVSPANAIGTMQVIPAAGEWASGLTGRKLNLLDPQDNVTAGVTIIRQLLRDAKTEDVAIAGYYQGQYSVSVHGMFDDTRNYVAGIKANRQLFG